MDAYTLITGEKGHGGFEEIGTLDEKPPLILQNLMSYDEIKLSAFLSISSHTEFINNGTRLNNGKVEVDKSKIIPEGVIIGVIGSRFQRCNVMDAQDIMITSSQNIKENGYGKPDDDELDELNAVARFNKAAMNLKLKLDRANSYRRIWNEFYENESFLHRKIVKNETRIRFYKMPGQTHIFDNVTMKKRFAISMDTLLLDAEARAAAAGKQAFIHVVGFGLGVWKVVGHQEGIFLETFTERLKVLLSKLTHVSVVHFSYFKLSEHGELKDGGILRSDAHPEGGIKTFISNRNPADTLNIPGHENMLLIASYAWDGNALPGNEFWEGSLHTSSDPAAACSTLITELHNPHINTEMINGENLHIASDKYGVVHIADYAKSVLQ